MFSLSASDENGNPVFSKASGPIHVINMATRSVEGCLPNPVTISYVFGICTHFFQFADRFPLVSNFWGSDTLAINLGCGGLKTAGASEASGGGIFVDSKWQRSLHSIKTTLKA